MTVENISWSISTKECCRPGGGWTRNLLIFSRTRVKAGWRPPVIFLLTVSRRFLCFSSSLFVRLWFHMWCLFCLCLSLIFPLFGASARLCFVIVAFPGYHDLYLYLICSCTKINEPHNDKTNKMDVPLAKTQIYVNILPVWQGFRLLLLDSPEV